LTRRPITPVAAVRDRAAEREGITPDQYHLPLQCLSKALGPGLSALPEDLRRNNALDFEDLLAFVVVLFRRFPDVLASYQDLCRYVMVDEFQDTNLIQYHSSSRSARGTRTIFVVGDDDQSIYRWRGRRGKHPELREGLS